MFGCCSETPSLMPLPIDLAHRLAEQLAAVAGRHDALPAPDGKTQVTIEYDGDRPLQVDTVVLSTFTPQTSTSTHCWRPFRKHVVDPILGGTRSTLRAIGCW